MSRPGSSVQHLRQTPTFAKEKNSINGYKDHEYICITGNNYYLFSPTDILQLYSERSFLKISITVHPHTGLK